MTTSRRLPGAGRALVIAALATAAAAGSVRPLPATAQTPEAPPRNFLIIVTDDQRGESMAVMPRTRAWFKGAGTIFPNAFATTPLCCPSRASIFTGRYAHNHGVQTNAQARRLEQETTIQYYLQNAGYRTGMIGKYLNGWTEPPPYFDDWAITKDHTYYNSVWNVGGQQMSVGSYGTDFVRNQSLEFLSESETNDQQPWFLVIAPQAPHAPYTPERAFTESPVPDFVPDASVNHRNGPGKPPFMRTLQAKKEGAIRRIRSRQLRTLKSVDLLVGAVRAKLEELGELEQTAAFYLSDNGFTWGEHRLLGSALSKATPHTASINIPMFMWLAERPPGLDPRLVAPLDIAPTIMSLASAATITGPEMDGRSLLGNWSRDWLLIERWPTKNGAQVPEWRSLRGVSAQYMRYGPADPPEFREYYDLKNDPEQLHNLLTDGTITNDPDVASLDALIDDYADCVGPECP